MGDQAAEWRPGRGTDRPPLLLPATGNPAVRAFPEVRRAGMAELRRPDARRCGRVSGAVVAVGAGAVGPAEGDPVRAPGERRLLRLHRHLRGPPGCLERLPAR